jgi:hypothetical protein
MRSLDAPRVVYRAYSSQSCGGEVCCVGRDRKYIESGAYSVTFSKAGIYMLTVSWDGAIIIDNPNTREQDITLDNSILIEVRSGQCDEQERPVNVNVESIRPVE